MSDTRFIINEVRRVLPNVSALSLSILIDSSPTLKGIIESQSKTIRRYAKQNNVGTIQDAEETVTLITNDGKELVVPISQANEVAAQYGITPIVSVEGTGTGTGAGTTGTSTTESLENILSQIFITPEQVQAILQEVEISQNQNIDKESIAQTLQGVRNNPYFITPEEAAIAKQYNNFEEITFYENSLLATPEGEIFIDPETGAAILAPTPNVVKEAPPTSPEGYIGDLTPEDVEVMLTILADEVREELEYQGYTPSTETITDEGKIGKYGLTIEELVGVGVVTQNAIDDWEAIPEIARGDYAFDAVKLGLISEEQYNQIPVSIRSALHWYVMTNKRYWLEKLIGPENMMKVDKIQRLLAYRHMLKNWKTTFRFFMLQKIFEKAQIAGYLIAQKLFGKKISQLFGLGPRFASIIGKTAIDVFDRATRGVLATQNMSPRPTDIKKIDAAAKTVPPVTPKPPASGRKFEEFPTISEQPSNTPVRKIPKNQGFYDPKNVYPRVKRIAEPDTNRLARHQKIQNTIVATKEKNRITDIPVARRSAPVKWSEPKSPYNAKYPYNHVRESESGHIIEEDDTPNNERLHWYHREGTYHEIDRNGTSVRRIVGDGYEVYERDGNIYVGGRCNITVEGNCNLYVKTHANVQVDGDLIADVHRNMIFHVAKNIDMSAGESINIRAKQFINIESKGENINIKAPKTVSMTGRVVNVRGNQILKLSGELKASLSSPNGQALLLSGAAAVVVNGPGLSILPAPGFAAKTLATANRAQQAGSTTNGEPVKEKNPKEPKHPPLVLESRVDTFSEALSTLAENADENQNEIAALKKKGVDEGLVTPEDLNRPLTPGASDASPPPASQPAKVAACNLIYGESNFPPSYRLSANVTLGMLKGVNINNQHGLSKQDIICNLKQLSENVIEPVFTMLGKSRVLITSGYRYPGYNTGSMRPAVGISFHEQGLGVDMCFLNTPFSKYYDIASQFKQGIQYDKLLLEYRLGTVRGVTTYKPWIHIQWQQPDINMANGRKGGRARLEAFTMKNDARVSPTGTLVNLLSDSTLQY